MITPSCLQDGAKSTGKGSKTFELHRGKETPYLQYEEEHVIQTLIKIKIKIALASTKQCAWQQLAAVPPAGEKRGKKPSPTLCAIYLHWQVLKGAFVFACDGECFNQR